MRDDLKRLRGMLSLARAEDDRGRMLAFVQDAWEFADQLYRTCPETSTLTLIARHEAEGRAV